MASGRAIRDQLSKSVGAISIITFGAGKELSRGAQATITRALQLSWRYPKATVVFGEFRLNLVQGLEEGCKRKIFPSGKFFGRVISTIEDIERPLQVLGPDVKQIVFVTDEAHSRSVKKIAEKVLAQNNSRQQVFINCVSTKEVIDSRNPMEALRDPRDWIAVNRFREFVLWFPFGFELLKGSGAHQPTSEVRPV